MHPRARKYREYTLRGSRLHKEVKPLFNNVHAGLKIDQKSFLNDLQETRPAYRTNTAHEEHVLWLSLVGRRDLAEQLQVMINGFLLILQMPAQHRAQHGIPDVVGGVGLAGQVAPLDLVLPLSSCFHPLQTPGNGLFLSLQKARALMTATSLLQAIAGHRSIDLPNLLMPMFAIFSDLPCRGAADC